MKIPKIFVPENDLEEKIKEHIGPTIFEKISQLHEDPNLSYAISALTIAPEIPTLQTLMLELSKLASEETLNAFKRKGIQTSDVVKIVKELVKITETQGRKCIHAGDFFRVIEDIVPDRINNEILNVAKERYFQRIKVNIIDGCFDEPFTIKQSVMDYVHMAQAMLLYDMEHDDIFEYKDPETQTLKSIKIIGRYVFAVEERLGHMTTFQKNGFRTKIYSIYNSQVAKNPRYDFMENSELVNAVADVKLKSNIISAGSLIGALTNRTNEDDKKIDDKIVNNMIEYSKYCKDCAEKTIEQFCTWRE